MKKILANHYRYSFLFLLAALAFGQLTRVQLTPALALNLADLIAPVILVIWLRERFLKPRPFSLPPTAPELAAFTLTALLGLFLNHLSTPLPASAFLYFFRWLTHAGVFLAAFDLLVSNRLAKAPLVTLISWVFVAAALLGLLQYLFWPDTRLLFFQGWDEHLNRLIFPYLDPGFTGLILAWGALWIFSKPRSLQLLLPVILVALALTYSRSSYLAFATGLLFLGYSRHRLDRSLLTLGVFALLVVLLPRTAGEGVKLERTASVTARVESNTHALAVFRRQPLLGIGMNAYPAAKTPFLPYPDHASAPDNSFIFLLLTTGLLGTAAYLYWQIRLLMLTANHALPLSAILISWNIHALFNNSLFYAPAALLFWVIAAVTLAPVNRNTPR